MKMLFAKPAETYLSAGKKIGSFCPFPTASRREEYNFTAP